MRAPAPRPRRRRFPVTPATKPVRWVLRNVLDDPPVHVVADSLSALGCAIVELDLPPDRWVILERNGVLIYRGPWKGDLLDAPTLM